MFAREQHSSTLSLFVHRSTHWLFWQIWPSWQSGHGPSQLHSAPAMHWPGAESLTQWKIGGQLCAAHGFGAQTLPVGQSGLQKSGVGLPFASSALHSAWLMQLSPVHASSTQRLFAVQFVSVPQHSPGTPTAHTLPFVFGMPVWLTHTLPQLAPSHGIFTGMLPAGHAP